MKTIHISDELYEGIAARESNVDEFMERAARKALDQTLVEGTPRFDAEMMKAKFREFGENFAGVTLADLKADIEYGRE